MWKTAYNIIWQLKIRYDMFLHSVYIYSLLCSVVVTSYMYNEMFIVLHLLLQLQVTISCGILHIDTGKTG